MTVEVARSIRQSLQGNKVKSEVGIITIGQKYKEINDKGSEGRQCVIYMTIVNHEVAFITTKCKANNLLVIKCTHDCFCQNIK